jgi:hypothetical protein
MNRLLKDKLTREMLSEIRSSNRCGSHAGCLKIWKGCTYEHELGKFDVCFSLINKDWSVYTEAIFNSGHRADIVAIKEGQGIIIEILDSEKEKVKKLEENPKKCKYPQIFEFYEVNCEDAKKFEI